MYGQSLVQAHNFRRIISALSIVCDVGILFSKEYRKKSGSTFFVFFFLNIPVQALIKDNFPHSVQHKRANVETSAVPWDSETFQPNSTS